MPLPDIAGRLSGLGQIDQLSYAVRDLEQALPRYKALFGHFRTARLDVDDLIYRGKPATAIVDVAFGRSGNLEIELVAPVSGQFAQQEFLARYGEGLHHVRFTVDDIDAGAASLADLGFKQVMRGQSPRAIYAYYELAEMMGDSLVELVQWIKQ